MKKTLIWIGIISLILSCSKTKTGSLTVQGSVEGLKKGTLYLQKYQDTALIAVDSIELNGLDTFTLVDDIQDPELYFLTLNEKTSESISFFGEKGVVTITTKLAKFHSSSEIIGGKNQQLWQEYLDMSKKFNDQQLDYIKQSFEAQRDSDTALFNEVEKNQNNLTRRKYLYTTNFALNNSEHEVAAYLGLAELYNANIKLLDTVNNSLSEKVKQSKYGIKLNDFIREIKDSIK